MSRKLIALIGFCFVLVTVAYAEPPKIIKGYGLTEWGQSVEQVKKLVPNLKEVTPSREYVIPAQESFGEIRYWFVDDKLYRIEIPLSGRAYKEVGIDAVDKIIQQKYYDDKEVKDLLRKNGIHVGATAMVTKWGVGVVIYENQSIYAAAMEKAKKEHETKRQEAIKELRLEDLL